MVTPQCHPMPSSSLLHRQRRQKPSKRPARPFAAPLLSLVFKESRVIPFAGR